IPASRQQQTGVWRIECCVLAGGVLYQEQPATPTAVVASFGVVAGLNRVRKGVMDDLARGAVNDPALNRLDIAILCRPERCVECTVKVGSMCRHPERWVLDN